MIALIFSIFLGPYGGDVKLLSRVGEDTLLCGVKKKLFLSEDDLVWKEIEDFPDINPISFVEVKGLWFLGTEDRGVWLSNDGGLSWEQVKEVVPLDSKVVGFYPVPPSYNNVVIFTHRDGVYLYNISIDEIFKRDVPFHLVFSVSYLGESVVVGTEKGVYVSDDGCISWSNIWDEDSVGTVYMFSKDSKVYLLFERFRGVSSTVYLTDFTEFWESGLREHVNDFLFSEDTVYAATVRGVFISTTLSPPDWIELNQGLRFKYANRIVEFKDAVICGATDGVYRLEKGEWVERKDSLTGCIVTSILKVDGTLYISTLGSGMMRYGEYGWEEVSCSEPYLYEIVHRDNEIFGASHEGVFRYTVDGDDCEYIKVEADTVYTLTCYGKRIYLGTDRGLYVSDEGVERFSKLWDVYKVYDVVVDSPYIYIATEGGLYKSYDMGGSFVKRSEGLPDGPVVSLALDANYRNKVLCSTGPFNRGVYISKDYGETWSLTMGDRFVDGVTVSDSSFLVYAYNGTDTLYISTDTGRVFSSMVINGMKGIDYVYTDFLLKRIYVCGYEGVELVQDSLPPDMSIYMPKSFSPEGDGVEDSLEFFIDYMDLLPISFWSFSVLKDGDTLYHSLRNEIPDVGYWDGYDSNGGHVGACSLNVTLVFYDALLNGSTLSYDVVSSPLPFRTGDSLCCSTNSRKVDFNGDTVYMVYSSYRIPEIFLIKGYDDIFQIRCVSSSRDVPSVHPVIDVEGKNLMLVWVDRGENDLLLSFDGSKVDTVFIGRDLQHPSVYIEDTMAYLSFSGYSDVSESRDIYVIGYNFKRCSWDEFPLNITQDAPNSDNSTVFYIDTLILIYTEGDPPYTFKTYGIPSPELGTGVMDYDAVTYNDAIYVGVLTEGHDLLFLSYNHERGWSNIDTVDFDGEARALSLGVDEALNVYMLVKDVEGNLSLLIKEHDGGWISPIDVVHGVYGFTLPDVMFDKKVFWVERTGEYLSIDSEDVDILVDTLAPIFNVEVPDTLRIGDTLVMDINTERLQFLEAGIVDVNHDTLGLNIRDMPDFYRIEDRLRYLSSGEAFLYIKGKDLAGNESDTLFETYIVPGVELVEDEGVFVFPNPVKKGEDVNIRIRTGEDVEGYIYILNIRGDVLYRRRLELEGGEEYSIAFPTDNLETDIYVVSLLLHGIDSGRNRRILKKFILRR